MYAGPNDGHWVLYAVYVPVDILYQSLGWWWVDLCVNQWSGFDHHHPRVTMYMGCTCAWKAQRDRPGCIMVINMHILQQLFWKCQCVVYNVWCALTWNSNFHHYIPGDMYLFCQLWSCWVPIGVGVLTLIRKHTLNLLFGDATQHAHIC